MNVYINFLFESSVSLGFLALVYILFLRKETYFRLNRYYLMMSVLFSAFLPFLHLNIYHPEPLILKEVTVLPYKNLLEAVTVYGINLSGNIEDLILSSKLPVIIYFLGFLFFSIRLFIRLFDVYRLIRSNQVVAYGNIKMVLLDDEFSPFSFFRYVFIGKNIREKDGWGKMIFHEMEHIRQGHSFDVIILEVISAVQWFNPFVWIFRWALRENHEFLADQGAISGGISRSGYKGLLLNQCIGLNYRLANNFNYSLIKTRLNMISKIRSSKTAIIKMIFGILAGLILVIAFACEQIDNIDTSVINDKVLKSSDSEVIENKLVEDSDTMLADLGEVFFIVEEMPEFPGGEMALLNYISNTIEYPQSAIENNIQGKVFVSFIIDKNGDTRNVSITRGVDPLLDNEAARVVLELPKWKPGKQRGNAVNVSYTIPINFSLE